MKLSEAIRLGSMLGPQVFDGLFDGNGGACAIGAAYLAIGQITGPLRDHFPWASHMTNQCPACPHRGLINGAVVAHLNDHHYWTREAIADWIETIEPKEAEPKVETHELAEVV